MKALQEISTTCPAVIISVGTGWGSRIARLRLSTTTYQRSRFLCVNGGFEIPPKGAVIKVKQKDSDHSLNPLFDPLRK